MISLYEELFDKAITIVKKKMVVTDKLPQKTEGGNVDGWLDADTADSF